jgi:hypothetical protein
MQLYFLFLVILLFKVIAGTYNEDSWERDNQVSSFEEQTQQINSLSNSENILNKILKNLQYRSDNDEFKLEKRLSNPINQSKFKTQYCLFTNANRRLCQFNHLN